MRPRLRIASLVFAIAGITNSATAAVTYTYIGAELGLNSIALFTPTDRVTGFITLKEAPSTGNFIAPDMLNYDFQLGGMHLSKVQGAGAAAYLQVSPSGFFTSWSFVIGNYSQTPTSAALIEIWANSADLAPGGDRIVANYHGSLVLAAVTQPGQWTLQASAVPEPSSVALLSCGLLLSRMRRRSVVRWFS